MHVTRWTAAIATIATAALLTQTLPARAQTVQEVLAKSLAARGGHDKLAAIKTRREVGRLSLGEGSEFPIEVDHVRPRKMRMVLTLQGASLLRSFDGEHGWQWQPQAKAPEALAGDDLHNISNEAEFDFAGYLIDTAAKGKAELAGKETYDGHQAYKVKLTLNSGDVFVYGIDSTSYLPIHWEGGRSINGKRLVYESSFSDYRDVGGIKYPFLIVSSLQGSAQHQKMTFTTIENNPRIDEVIFEMPAAPAAPAAGAAPPAAPAPAVPPAAAHPPAASSPPPPPAKPPGGGSLR
jgi:hypothetical protein